VPRMRLAARHSYRLARDLARRTGPLTVGSGAAVRRKLHGTVRNGEPQGGADCSFHQADFAAMGPHQFGRDGKAKAGAAGAG